MNQPSPWQPGGYRPSYLPPSPPAPEPAPPPEPPEREPGAGTAIATGVLAVLGGLWHSLGVAGNALTLFSSSIALGGALLSLVVNAVLAVVLLFGGVRLLMRRYNGRLLVVTGSALAIVAYLADLVFSAFGLHVLSQVAVGNRALAVLVLGVPAVTTLVLALLPATGRWLFWVYEDPYWDDQDPDGIPPDGTYPGVPYSGPYG
jgi:hypothetical protein